MIHYFKKVKLRIYYYRTLYKKYKTQKRKYASPTIKFYNFWKTKNIEDFWFYRFITYNNLDSKKMVLNFISVFGDKNLIWFIRGGFKIFFTGENLNPKTAVYSNYIKYEDHYGDKVDLALGFNCQENMPVKYMRFPLWITYFVPAESTLRSLKKLISKYNSPETRKNTNRVRFAVHISRHDRNEVRSEIIQDMNTIENVCCAGKFMNNTNELKEVYNDNKLVFLKNYKFNICPENSNSSGYVTEKLFHSIISGCIPVYWGSDNLPEPEIINPDAVLFYDRNNKEEFLKKVKELIDSESAYQDFLNIPPFKDHAAETIWKYLEELKSRLNIVVEK